jgi:hypothetical protein
MALFSRRNDAHSTGRARRCERKKFGLSYRRSCPDFIIFTHFRSSSTPKSWRIHLRNSVTFADSLLSFGGTFKVNLDVECFFIFVILRWFASLGHSLCAVWICRNEDRGVCRTVFLALRLSKKVSTVSRWPKSPHDSLSLSGRFEGDGFNAPLNMIWWRTVGIRDCVGDP